MSTKGEDLIDLSLERESELTNAKNLEFDNRLQINKLDEFIRRSDYIENGVDIKLLHTKCNKEFSVKPRNFFKRKNKCLYCSNIKLGNNNSKKIKANNTLKNSRFDNKLKKDGLIGFIRKSDYVDRDTEIKLLHVKCNKEFSVKPSAFYKRKHKCPYCYNKGKNIKKSKPKNEYYQNKIDEMTNKEFLLLSDYYNLNSYVKLKHISCGHIFEIRADNFELSKDKCPKCSNKKNIHSKTISQKINELESLLNNEYEIITKAFNSEDMIWIRHKSCGKKMQCSVSSITKLRTKQRTGIKCPTCNLEYRRDEFLDKLDRMYGREIKMTGSYKGMRTPTKFYHSKCDQRFEQIPFYLLKNKLDYCPKCKEETKEMNFKQKLYNLYKDEFKLVSRYNGYNELLKLKHKKCGSIIEISPANLFKRNHPCTECFNKERTLKNKLKYEKAIKAKHGENIVFAGDYLGSRVKTEFYCNICDNSFFETPDIVLRKRNCPHCTKKKLD